MEFTAKWGTASRETIVSDEACHDGVRALTLIVPTRNEAGNIPELLIRLSKLPAGLLEEIVFVDDSDDETPAVIKEAAGLASVPVRLVHRPKGSRKGGLSGAVIEGLRRTTASWVCVMDGDLQHPPAVIPRLVRAAERERVDILCATRNTGGGDRTALSPARDLLSRSSTLTARTLFPRRLRGVSDPMSGFFLVRREAIDIERLRPTGFKILLEILVRTPHLRRAELPFSFDTRYAGESKAGLRQGLAYLGHLVRLRLGLDPGQRRILDSAGKFALVGLAGIVVNQAMLWFLVSVAGLGYLVGAVVATQASTVSNFGMTELWVFPSTGRKGILRRYLGFAAMNNIALLGRVPLLAALVSQLGMHYLVANLLTLVTLFAVRFVVSDRVIWRRAARGRQLPAPVRPLRFLYRVHDLVGIASEVELRELSWFRTDRLDHADIEVRRGLVGSCRLRSRADVTVAEGRVLYEEHLGALITNFSVDLRSQPIRIVVGPLLAASPHVVYTNVVEALLRFVLVTRGCMLLHSATIEIGGTAVMLSARTDTGKTCTILRMLREQGGAFLSDDMTIVEPDGTAHCYPKPLTISAHTLRAVNRAALTPCERARLAVQSRIHSKSGRTFAMGLAAMNLPIMAVNACAQMVVPPPKYMVTRLLDTTVRHFARVSQLFIIERGEPSLTDIDPESALEQLVQNTDDAYGFPPFAQFAPAIALGGDGYLTLRAKERAILARFLGNIRIRRLASDSFGWADDIPALLADESVSAPGDAAGSSSRTHEEDAAR